MKNLHNRILHPAFQSARGISIPEILMVVAISAVVALFTIPMVINSPNGKWPHLIEDYVQHLSSVYNKVQLENGDSPINAELVPDPDINAHNPKYADGIESVLVDWETLAFYSSSAPQYLSYPNKIRVYLDPENTNIPDPQSQLPIHQAGSPATIMAGTDNKEWLLVDMDGASGTNRMDSTDPKADRVLLIVDDATGRILTAWQKCIELGGATNGPMTTCTMSSPAPSRVYYKSFYDVYKGY